MSAIRFFSRGEKKTLLWTRGRHAAEKKQENRKKRLVGAVEMKENNISRSHQM